MQFPTIAEFGSDAVGSVNNSFTEEQQAQLGLNTQQNNMGNTTVFSLNMHSSDFIPNPILYTNSIESNSCANNGFVEQRNTHIIGNDARMQGNFQASIGHFHQGCHN